MIRNRIIYTDIIFGDSKINIAALMDSNNHFQRLSVERDEHKSLIGNIYIGKVASIQQNLDAAFVDIGDGKTVYCSLDKKWEPIYTHKFAANDRLCQGDEILIQIEKDPIKTKKAVATTNLSFDGEHIVVTTGNIACGISRKLPEDFRQELKAKLNPIIEAYGYGIVVRTSAKDLAISDLISEIEDKCHEVDGLLQQCKSKAPFTLVKAGKNQLYRFLDEITSDDYQLVDEFVTDKAEVYDLVANDNYLPRTFEKYHLPKPAIRLYADESYSMNKLYSIEHQLLELLKPTVWLDSGASLVIEPTEAMTVIDVNTGRNIKKNMSFLDVNKEACDEIIRQLIVRNISGIIIVDFINLDSEDKKAELLQYFRSNASKASSFIQVLDYTKLGLVEVTKKKTSKSIYQILN